MLDGMRTYARALANGMMETSVTIRHRSAYGKDSTNKSGDDVTTWDPTTTTVTGWFVDPGSATISDTGGLSAITDKPTVRLPVGTVVKERDQLIIGGKTWIAEDVSDGETWSAMLRVSLVREQ